MDLPSAEPMDILGDDYEDLLELGTSEIEPIIPEPPVPELVPISEENLTLGQRLVVSGLISSEQLATALRYQRIHGGRLGSLLVSLNFIKESVIEGRLGQRIGLNACEIDSLAPTPKVLAMIPEPMMRRYLAIPLRTNAGQLIVGMVNPNDQVGIGALSFVSGQELEVERISASTFKRFVETRFASEAFQEENEYLRSNQAAFITTLDPEDEEDDEVASEVVGLVDFIIDNAVQRRASDIHIEPYDTFFRIRFRVDGTLYNFMAPTMELCRPLVSRLKVLGRMDISERRKPQDGQMRTEVRGQEIDFRISTLPTVYGEKCVIRLLRREAHLADLSRLGFRPDQSEDVAKAARLLQGLVLVTGPTGSGKTTTLHAILNYINEPDINIVTLEDPVEAMIPGVNHVTIREKGGVNFADGLRSILRQDPDVIFIGEMRDAEVAKIAIKAALTGHLVLSTLHTNGVVETFSRLIDMGLDTYLLASSIQLVLAQRLLRRLCRDCSIPDPIPRELVEEFTLTREQVASAVHRSSRGCPRCMNTGYRGRVAAFESLRPSEDIRRILRKGGDEQQLKDATGSLVTLREAAIARALAGETSFEEVRRLLGTT